MLKVKLTSLKENSDGSFTETTTRWEFTTEMAATRKWYELRNSTKLGKAVQVELEYYLADGRLWRYELLDEFGWALIK